MIKALLYSTYLLLFYVEDPTAAFDERNVTAQETRIRYDHLAELPRRPWAFPCRSLCGMDLRRPHVTCMSCRLRRVYSCKLPKKIPVQSHTIWIHKGRRFDRIKAPLLKRLLTICELLAN